VGMFHLMTHAFFKAVLFLGAGSVIIALHHEQDMRKMGGLRKFMPITYWTVLIGALANAGIPPFSGFFSKDTIIEALHASHTPGHEIAYWLAMAGVFVSAVYSFRLVFFAFHGEYRGAHHGDHGDHEEKHDDHGHHGDPHESPAVVTIPLVLLAIPSLLIGGLTIGSMVYGDWFGSAVMRGAVMEELSREFHGPLAMIGHAF